MNENNYNQTINYQTPGLHTSSPASLTPSHSPGPGSMNPPNPHYGNIPRMPMPNGPPPFMQPPTGSKVGLTNGDSREVSPFPAGMPNTGHAHNFGNNRSTVSGTDSPVMNGMSSTPETIDLTKNNQMSTNMANPNPNFMSNTNGIKTSDNDRTLYSNLSAQNVSIGVKNQSVDNSNFSNPKDISNQFSSMNISNSQYIMQPPKSVMNQSNIVNTSVNNHIDAANMTNLNSNNANIIPNSQPNLATPGNMANLVTGSQSQNNLGNNLTTPNSNASANVSQVSNSSPQPITMGNLSRPPSASSTGMPAVTSVGQNPMNPQLPQGLPANLGPIRPPSGPSTFTTSSMKSPSPLGPAVETPRSQYSMGIPPGPPTSMPVSSVGSTMGPPSMVQSISGGPPNSSVGPQALQPGPPTSQGVSQMGKSMGPSFTGQNPLTPRSTGPPPLSPSPMSMTTGHSQPIGQPRLMGPPPMGLPSSMGVPRMGPPTSMGPPSMGPPTSMVPPSMGPPTSMGLPSMGPPPAGPPTSGPPPMGPTVSGGPRPSGSAYRPGMPQSMGRNTTIPHMVSSPGFQPPHAYNQQPTYPQGQSQIGSPTLRDGWNKAWGNQPIDLLQQRIVLPAEGVVPPKPALLQECLPNCSPEIFRCTMTKVPQTKSVLQKSRLPFGILIHPFKDLEHLPVVSCNTIVRCRACRTYINPFVVFRGDRQWECNLCFRVNELPEEFQYDPLMENAPTSNDYNQYGSYNPQVTQTYGDPSRRPEVKEATIEFIAPQEYMLRPPQPATYIWVLETTRQAIDTGYLKVVCETLYSNLDKIPGDKRTMVGFITYSSSIQFYSLGEGMKSPQMLDVGDIDDVFIPCPTDLLINLHEQRDLIEDFLTSLPETHAHTHSTQSALGAALKAAFKLLSPIGGRITVMAATLPSLGPGALKSREDPNQRASVDVANLGPATDFYKQLALQCSGQQIAVDLFTLNSQYIDLATLTGMSKFSGGCIHHFPNFSITNNLFSVIPFINCLERYITRKIGFEAVMRIRATRGLAISNFHGNFFVRSTDLLSLPNINPDAGFGMQVNVDESLVNIRQACFQAALLYTSSKGERRIRVHTLCLPVSPHTHEIINSADQQAIIGLLSKMAVDRCTKSAMSDARDGIVNACVDILSSFKNTMANTIPGALQAPPCLTLLPLYCLSLLKSVSFRSGLSTKLDDRTSAMCELKSLPLFHTMLTVYPDLYPIHQLTDKGALSIDDMVIPQPGRIHLSAERLERNGAYLMDAGSIIYIYVRAGISAEWVDATLGVPSYAAIPQPLFDDPIPVLDTDQSELLRNFITYLQKKKPYPAPIQVLREENPARLRFIERLVDDRTEGSHSYIEYLQFIKCQVK